MFFEYNSFLYTPIVQNTKFSACSIEQHVHNVSVSSEYIMKNTHCL